LLVIRRDPDRPAMLVLRFGRKFVGELVPQTSRVTCQCQLSFIVIHENYMPHACCGCSCCNAICIEHEYPKSRCRQTRGTRCSDNPRTDDRDVVTHLSIPKRSGSCGSRIRSISAVTYAEPRMIGIIFSPSSRTRPSNK